ncbi:MAG: GIY-YIG nuclease family protein [Bacillota bacterium]
MDFTYDSGIYLLEIYLPNKVDINIGAKGECFFPDGLYYYTGSAQKNLQARVERHFSDKKNNHWHIDYFLEKAQIRSCCTWPLSGEKECELAHFFLNKLNGKIIVSGFGASDCNCDSHLFLMTEDFAPVYNFQAEFPNICLL